MAVVTKLWSLILCHPWLIGTRFIPTLWGGSDVKHSEAQVLAIHVVFAVSASYLLYPYFFDIFHQI